MSNKFEYEKPSVEVSNFECENFIATSTLENLEKGGEWGWS